MLGNNNNFGETLRRLRKERGLSLEELANKIGTTKQVLSKYENGKRNPRISMAKAIADALGIKVQELTFDENSVTETLTPDERKFVENFRLLSTSNKLHVISVLNAFVLAQLGKDVGDDEEDDI